jgi:hypothetical protein
VFAALYPVIWKLPVATVHVGCVTTPIVGALGVLGCALTKIVADAAEIHPAVFLTVKVYVLAFAVTNPVAEILTTPGVKV